MTDDKILKYFEIAITEARTWTMKDYVLFVIDSLYSTVMPFFAGARLVATGDLLYLFLLILPIVLKVNLLKRFDKRKKMQKIYVR